MRIAFALLMLFHGLIHVMGFVKAFGFAEIPQLTLPVSKFSGLLWMLAALLFVGAAGLLLMKQENWWYVALPAVLLSQALIFSSFQDAKFGTIANLLVVAGIALGYGQWSFARQVREERQFFHSVPKAEAPIVTEADLADLPPIVQQWLHHSGIVGKPLIRQVHLRQSGEMQTSPGGRWMPFTATQEFALDPPAFHWVADVRGPLGLPIAGRDQYKDGKGQMLIKLLSLIPVVNASGPETDQGTLLRYLAEIIWFPSAALSDYVSWEEMDSTSAKATMTYGGLSASGVFQFTPEGDMLSFEAQRYYDRKEGATLEIWHIETEPGGYETFEGIRVPARSAVTWKLETGDYTWLKLEVEEITYR